MNGHSEQLWYAANDLLKARKPGEGMCYLAEILGINPADRHARLGLALALGDAGNPAGALRVLRGLAGRLVHDGYQLPAIVVIRHGLHHVGDDKWLLEILQGLHVRGVRAKAGNLAVPPPLKSKKEAAPTVKAATLLSLPMDQRLQRVEEVGVSLPPAGPAAKPLPMPLFCELQTSTFVQTVKRLSYRRVEAGSTILQEGAPGDSLLILVSGHVSVAKGTTVVGQLGSGAVIGEMALITNAPRSANVTAVEPVEYLELSRSDVADLAKTEPKVMQELAGYCRGRLLLNLLRTSPLFSRFDEATRMRLLERFQTASFRAGQEIITQGQQGTGLYVIASGQVQVQITGDDGNVVLVGTLGPGEVFGEISLLKNQPTTADVIAQDTVGAVVLPSADFQQVLGQYPEVRKYLEGLSADRLKASQEICDAEMIDADDLVVL